MEISQARYDYIQALDPAIAESALARLDITAPGTTEAYHAMTKKIKIDTALDAFGSGKISGYMNKISGTNLKFTPRDLVSATKDSKKTQNALDNFDKVPLTLKGEGGYHFLKPSKQKQLTFEELNKQIEVNTGIDIETQLSSKEYKKAITKALGSLKSSLPESIYKERKDIIWNSLRSIDHHGGVEAHSSKSHLDKYFELKSDDTTADSILEEMFEDPEIYQLWLEENK